VTLAARERTFSTFDARAMFFRDWGDALSRRTPVLCLAGLTRNSRDFDRLAPRLAANGHRVLCPDLRGRGRSQHDPDWRNYDPRVYLDDIRHLLASLGVGRVVVVGTSLGGLLGMAMAMMMPSSLAGLILNDVGPDVSPGGLKRILSYVGTDAPQPDWPAAVAFLRKLLPRLSLATDEDWLTFAQNTYRAGADGKLHFDWDVALARPLAQPQGDPIDLWQLWRAIAPIPALAIRGAISDILLPETFDRMKSLKPDLVQVTLPGVGHAPSLNEAPAREAIDEFLRRI
jgi:pimeloyl-ACP methyl ester carboxylesterase